MNCFRPMGHTKDEKKAASDVSFSANDFKEQGNRCFVSRKYSEAVVCYSKAIAENGNVATFYTNRALCYVRLKQWDLACSDCRRALQLDHACVKAYFFLGQALTQQQHYDEAIANLMRAHELSKEQRLNFGDDITSALRAAKRRKWMLAEERRVQQPIELQSYLTNLMTADTDRKLSEVAGTATASSQSETVPSEEVEQLHLKRCRQLNDIFAQVDDRRKKHEVPDVLFGRISSDVMSDPIITPSGITYDRRDINEHLQRVGHFDPVTRKDLTNEQLIPNLAMKEVIDGFLQDNPWVKDY